jgi:hypothetical protein
MVQGQEETFKQPTFQEIRRTGTFDISILNAPDFRWLKKEIKKEGRNERKKERKKER